MRRQRLALRLIGAASAFVHCSLAAAQSEEALRAASGIVGAGGASGGVIAVVGGANAELPLALAKQGSFVVHCLYSGAAIRDAARRAIRAQGLYGTVSAHRLEGGKRLPYADNLVNLVVAPDPAGGKLPAQEFARILAPLGTAHVQRSDARLVARLKAAGLEALTAPGPWVALRKPWPADIDEWTHFLHGADGNPVARDSVVGPPEHYQWIAEPMWMRSHESDSSVSTLVTAQGRLFAIVDEAPISLAGPRGLPDKWSLVARDAFNGVLLWKVPIRRWGWREWKPTWFTNRPGDFPLDIRERLVAVGDRVYVTLGYRAPVSELDARTGEILQTYADTEGAGEVMYVDGTLIVPVFTEGKLKVVAVDAATGKRRWVTAKGYAGSKIDYVKFNSRYDPTLKAPTVDPAANAATDGETVALIDGTAIVGLDFATGAEKWRADFPEAAADRTAGGAGAQDNLWNGTMIVTEGVVLHASPNKLAAFSGADGKLLWEQPKKYIGHLWYEWKDIFVIDGLVWTWGEDLAQGEYPSGNKVQRTWHPQTVKGYDLNTGEVKQTVPLGPLFKAHHHHRCYRNKATLNYILASRRGTEFVDLHGGKHTVHNWIRGICHVGMMPANGLQYAPPHPCACYLEEKLSGFNAVAPSHETGDRNQGADGPSVRLARGPAYGAVPNPQSAIADPQSEWPAFRHDSARTGAVETEVPGALTSLWRVSLGGKVSAPIVAGGKLFVSLIDEHHVVCLDATDGKKLWEYAAGARVDSPPTYHDGAVLFGSADGWVYCLRADEGQLAWRFRAAPTERLMCAFGQLESAWPVPGSVLVQAGLVYFSAGRTSQLDGGIYLYGLDAATGEVRHQARLNGPDYLVDDTGEKLVGENGEGPYDVNFRLPMGALPDILMSDGTHLYMRTKAFGLDLTPRAAKPALQARYGLLDDSYFKRTPWTFEGNAARLLVRDRRSAYYVRQFDTLRGLDPTVFFTPGDKGYVLFAKNLGAKQNTWLKRVPVRIRAMALTANALLVAGPPDVVDPKDPLGAFEGRKGGVLYVVDTASGERAKEYKLSSPPVFNGAAAASGRVYLAQEDGSLVCFGSR